MIQRLVAHVVLHAREGARERGEEAARARLARRVAHGDLELFDVVEVFGVVGAATAYFFGTDRQKSV